MKLSAVSAITNNLVAARFWMLAAIVFAALAVVAPYLTVRAMKQKEKVVILDPGGTMIYSPLLGFEEAGLHAMKEAAAAVGTAVIEREELAAKIVDHDRAAAHLDELALARRNFIDGGDDMSCHQANR